ncbi:MAG: hypothetical protein AB1793_08355 [Candidatus Thermoplasmatota archaeon]
MQLQWPRESGRVNDRICSDSWKGYIDAVSAWASRQGFAGWDPYDALNSHVLRMVTRELPLLENLAIQVMKRSPVNLRRPLRVEKGRDVKGSALFAQAYARLCEFRAINEDRNHLLDCLNHLESTSLRGSVGFHCWASHYFKFRGADGGVLGPDVPDAIGTCEAIRALSAGYSATRERHWLDMAEDAAQFLVSELLEESQHGTYCKYHPAETNRVVLNASAKALQALIELEQKSWKNPYDDCIRELARFIVQKQSLDGSWHYSEYSNGKKRIQLDFHQGYMVEALSAHVRNRSHHCDDRIRTALMNGASFYSSVMFTADGRSLYRPPANYPVDIHNQAQGIITFSTLGFIIPTYLDLALTIADWTIRNMWVDRGYFIFRKYPILSNSIPYMRWNQAWMMLALATLEDTAVKHPE